MKEKSLYVLVTVAVLTITLLLQLNKVEPFESFSLRFNDINFNLQDKEPNRDIVFVAVDEKSVNAYGRWPWNREKIAQGIRHLNQAEIVLMDMIFSEPTSKISDQALSSSIENLNSSVCGFFLRQTSTQFMPEEELDILDDSALDLLQSQISKYQNPRFVSAPFAEINILPILESCTLSGSFSTLAESDQLLRSYPVAVYFNDKLFPSLGIQALRVKFDSDIKRESPNVVSLNNTKIKLNEKGFIRLNFYKKEQYNIISFLDVSEGKIDESYFKDKIVILGITEIGSGDVASTPIGRLYGPLLHYTFISNYLENHLINEPKYMSSIIMIVLIFLPLLLLFLIKKISLRVTLNTLAYMLTYIVVRYLFIYDMIYIDLFYPLMGILFSTILIELLAFAQEEKSSKFIQDAFSAYLSPDLLKELVKNPDSLSLGGENRELSILFSDIRGFTTISESMDANSLVKLLNRYFTPMTNSVLEHKGMLDKYIGDAVMAFFNAPVDVEDHANQACLSALDMIEKLNLLNKELEEENIPSLHIGIGINTAEVVVGNMGSNQRFNYTVMGDGVNLASRVESITKHYGVNILITEFTAQQLSSDFIYRKIEPVVVKGKEEPVILYELMPNSTKSREMKELYDRALDAYIKDDIPNATIIFQQLTENYTDSVSQYFLKNIDASLPWGVNRMTSK
jgi:adenylate cyclase